MLTKVCEKLDYSDNGGGDGGEMKSVFNLCQWKQSVIRVEIYLMTAIISCSKQQQQWIQRRDFETVH